MRQEQRSRRSGHTGRTRRPAAHVRTDAYPLFDLIPAPTYIFDDETLGNGLDHRSIRKHVMTKKCVQILPKLIERHLLGQLGPVLRA